ncbi:glycosyltransferase family 2 protein [Microbacterium sp. AK031]|uniref:glycosyltransferase family 2 protein n=1 Tax=Microbacterium sp. AK031 TaxID=2723076 RepID=UPI0021688555|nr:glycosyltransferase family 2 protein [Microbacterium sp. AK031]MCS3843814.1 hypothetical protein [Microbacterium sp. AK031]
MLIDTKLSRHEAIVIADDDVRYEGDALASIVADLTSADLVKPQNYFAPAPWRARWDTARSLLNRALGSEYPGTYARRRSTITAAGGYDADVPVREPRVGAHGAGDRRHGAHPRDLLIARRPPSVEHFLSQRVRQAYDSFAQPGRLLLEASVLPILICLRRRPGAIVMLVVLSMAVAEYGSQRDHGSTVFPRSSVFWIPLWIAERSIATRLAVGLRARGGVQYCGGRIRNAANPTRVLRQRLSVQRGHRSSACSGKEL